MAVPSSVDTGTPAPPDRLPLDPVYLLTATVPLLCRNPARHLIFTRGRHRQDNWLTSSSSVSLDDETAIAAAPEIVCAAAGVAQSGQKYIVEQLWREDERVKAEG